MVERQDSLPSSDGTASVLDERESPEAIVAEPDNPDDDRPVPELTLTEIEEELETHYWGTLSVVGALLIVLCVVGAIALTRFQQSSNAIWTWLITLLVVVVAYSIVRRGLFPLWESAPGFAVRLLWFHAQSGLASTVTRERLAELLARRTALHQEQRPSTTPPPSDPPPGIPEPSPVVDRLLRLVRKLGQVKLQTLLFVPLGIFGLLVIICAILEALGVIPPGLFGPGW